MPPQQYEMSWRGRGEAEPVNQFDRFVFHYTDRMKHGGDQFARTTCRVLLQDAQWAADEIRHLRAELAKMEGK